MNSADYAPRLCTLLDLDLTLYRSVIQALLDGCSTNEVAHTLDLPFETARSRISKIGRRCNDRAGRLPSERFPVRVAVLQLVVNLLEARLQVRKGHRPFKGPWSRSPVGDRECRLLGPTMRPYIKAAVRMMQGKIQMPPKGFNETLLEAALPYLERYMEIIRRPVDMRVCILAVRASYFEDECARLRATKR